MELKLFKLKGCLNESVHILAKNKKQAIQILGLRFGDPNFENYYWFKKPTEEDLQEVNTKDPIVLIG